MKSKRKVLVWIIVLFVLFMGGIYTTLLLLGSHHNMHADRPNGKLGMMPINGTPMFVTIAPGVNFKLDTGADASSITTEDLAKLEALGFKAKESVYPVIGRNGLGNINYTFKRYSIDLPLYDYRFISDSIGKIHGEMIPESLNVLHNVDLVPSSTGFSVLGIDFLEKFKIEYRYDEHAVAFYFNMPDGYESFAKLNVSHNPIRDLWQSNRYYMVVRVQNIANDYFLDTGLQRVNIKLPSAEKTRTKRQLSCDTVHTMYSKYEAFVDYSSWVAIGDRAGSSHCWYYDNNEEPYSINPFNFLKQDFVIDFQNEEILLHPFSSAISRR